MPNDGLPIPHLEIGTAGAALGGNHQCRLLLFVLALRARYLDTMAHGLIGHDNEEWGGVGRFSNR